MRAKNIKVGLFVLAGMLFAGIVIFLLGDERRLFETAVEYRTTFTDVQGLKPGASIRMGGLDIGHVASVGYGKDPNDSSISVTLYVVRSEAQRVKLDSKARIATKGLLGDKMIELTRGKSPEAAKLGADIVSEEPDDLLAKVPGMADKVDLALSGLTRVTESLGNEQLQKDLRRSAASLSTVLGQVADGDGYPHKFLSDKQEAERISRTVADLDRTAAELSATLAEVREIVARVKSGPGLTHDVIYGEAGKKELIAIGEVAHEAALSLKGIRESESLMHDVLYGGKSTGGDTLANVSAITGDLRVITAGMRQGKGTLGALLVDPSVYEDMKVLLGNVERNDVLRALVRYSIKQDEKKPQIQIGKTP